MKKLLVAFAALPLLAAPALAAQPITLSDGQLDKITAGESGGEASANGIAFGLADLGPITVTQTATNVNLSGANKIAVGQSLATASAESALFQAAAATHADTAASYQFPVRPF